MTTICITGDSHSALAAVADRFRQAGMAADQPLPRDSSIDLAVWHQRVLAGTQRAGEGAFRLSRLWDQLAIDLLLSNLDAPLWGWADAASVALLDFWAALDDSICFVLVCRSREQAVTEWLCAGADTRSEAELLADWQRQQQTLLRFHLRHPERSALVWADEAQAMPQALIARLARQWGLALQPLEAEVQPAEPRDAVLRQLAAHIAGQHPESAGLDGELRATVPSLHSDDQASAAAPTATELAAGYRRLLDRSAEQAALEAVRSAYESEATARSQAVAQRDAEAKAKAEALQRRDAETAAKNAAQTKVAELTKARDAEAQAKAQAQAKLNELQQESELLLQQLHVVQEELEQQFLQQQKLKSQLQQQFEASSQQIKALAAERDAEAKAKTEAVKQRDVEAQAKAEALKQRDAEAKAKAEALKQRDVEAKAKAEALKQRDVEAQAKAEAQSRLKEAQQEGELLLQQLHTVQEELEQYFLKQQGTQRDLDQLKARWARLLKSRPELQDIDAVELVSDGSDGKPLSWRLQHASVAGRLFDRLEFETVVEQGVAGFTWRRQPRGEAPLARWPASAKGEQEVTILPVKGGPDAMRRAAHLVQLSTSDSDLMLALPELLKRAMQAGHLELAPQRRDELTEALARYQQIMSSAQALVRFDGASLVGQQSNETRDVIAIALAGLSCAALRLPGFEFQVQLNKAGDGSTESMHLIFGEQTAGAPFQGWFSNVPNTAGWPVMALHLTPQGWASADWAALPAEDRAFVQALADSLAIVLVTLQADGVRVERAWSDWLKQATSLRQWSRQTPVPVSTPVPGLESTPEPTSPANDELLPTPSVTIEAETVMPPELPTEAVTPAAPKARKPRAKPAAGKTPALSVTVEAEVETATVPEFPTEAVTSAAPKARKPRAKLAASKTPVPPVIAPDAVAAPQARKRRSAR